MFNIRLKPNEKSLNPIKTMNKVRRIETNKFPTLTKVYSTEQTVSMSMTLENRSSISYNSISHHR